MTDHNKPLDANIQALLNAEKQRPLPDAEIQQRVFARVQASFGAPSQSVPQYGAAASTSGAAAGSVTSGVGGMIAKSAVIFALGMGAGALTHKMVVSPPEVITRTVYVERSAPPSEVREPLAPPSVETVPQKSVRPKALAKENQPQSSSLADESILITRAQSAFARKQFDAALGALAEHAHKFPGGQLAEEREALWIQTLLLRGDRQQAMQRATVFRERFPDSALWPALQGALKP